MFKNIVAVALLSALPMLSLNAENNLIKIEPFGSVVKNDPFFQEFEELQSDMDKIFEKFHKRAFANMPMMKMPSGFNDTLSMKLKTDVIDKGDYYEIVADLPNTDSSKIEVKTENGQLSISAKSERRKEEKKDEKIIHQERFVGSFYRSMSLPKDADASSVKTEYKNGVLTVTIAKKK